MKLALYWTYYKALQSFNIPFSVFAGLLGVGFEQNKITGFLSIFLISYLTGGLFLAAYFYEIRYANQHYFYANRGISRWRLIGTCFSVNAFFFLLFLIANYFFHAE